MKRNIKRIIITITMCICMLLTSILYVNAAENIAISYNSDHYGRGYSWHYEYTNVNRASGYSEANCIHNGSDEVCVYAFLRSSSYNGNTYTKKLEVSTQRAGSPSRTVLYTTWSEGSIEWNEPIVFSRGYNTQIHIVESAYFEVDSWEASYKYTWGEKSELGGKTVISGVYETR